MKQKLNLSDPLEHESKMKMCQKTQGNVINVLKMYMNVHKGVLVKCLPKFGLQQQF